MNKAVHFIILFVIFGILGFRVYSISSAENTKNIISPIVENITKKEIPKDYVTLTFAGDTMLDRGVKGNVVKNFNGDYSKLFEKVDIFKNDDISFVNLEGPVSNIGHNVGSIYSFRMPVETIPTLKNIGVDIVSFANNHVGDYTGLAFKDTMDRLRDNDIAWAGAGYNYEDAKTVRIITVNGIKIGYIGFSDVGPNWMQAKNTNPGILLANDPNIKEIISNAKSKTDFLVVSFHFGEEYKEYNDRQEYLAKMAVDSGADLVAGHHPHVAQDIEYYKEKPIIYSLGNFMFDQYFSPETMSGLVVQVEVKKDGTTQKLTKYKSIQNKKFQIESIHEIK